MSALPRILQAHELHDLARAIDFATTAIPRVQTADIKPIDIAASAAIDNWMSAPQGSIPTLELGCVLRHPPTPERHKAYVKPERWNGWDEAVPVKLQGCAIGDEALIFAWTGSKPGSHPKLWGAVEGEARLAHARSLAIGSVQILAEASMGALLAEFERQEIEPETSPGSSGSGSAPRI